MGLGSQTRPTWSLVLMSPCLTENGGGCNYSGPFTNYKVPFRSFGFPEGLSGAHSTIRRNASPGISTATSPLVTTM
ncbi:hypothetical protein BDV97DRAFT_315957, partial [Delphinella strobiligena]